MQIVEIKTFMKRISRLIWLLLFAVLGLQGLYAQQATVSGVVVDDTNQPLPGVAVVVPGTTRGSITNFEGRYSLQLQAEDRQLSFSFIGFTTQTVDVAGRSVIDVTLKPETTELDDVVVVGYGTMKKSSLTGASVSVTAENIKDFVGSGIDQALQGKAAGVQVVANSGQPGAGMQVQIRGASTLNAKDAQPLYVIDGVPVQAPSSALTYGLNVGNGEVSSFSALSNLSPDDIESMEILKDASASAIYGSRAANGVVLITTKSGKKGKTHFEYSGSIGWQDQGTTLDLMNLREFAQYRVDMAKELDLMNSAAEYEDPSILGEGTDWQDAIFRTAFMQQHNVSASGGTDVIRYYLSGGYYEQEGTVIGSAFDRYNFRINLDANVTDWLKVGSNFAYSVSKDKLIMNNSEDGIISLATWSTPDIPVYDMDGNYASCVRDGYSFRNPVAQALENENKLRRRNVEATFYADITFLKDFTLRSEYSLNDLFTNSYAFQPTYDYGSVVNTVNSATRGQFQNKYWQVKNYLTYNKQFLEDHNVTAMFGQETSEWKYENIRTTNTALTSNDIHNPSLGTGTPTISTGWGSGSRVSLFGRLVYGYKGRYNLTGTYRRDGSSNFGPSNRWGDFYSASASWRFSDEPFMAFARDIMSNGRIRVGWGQVGNDNIGSFAWGSSGKAITVGQMGKGYQVNNIANEKISWETQESWNFGLDLNFLRDRIQFIFEYYVKTSKDMLMTMQLPSYMGTEGNDSYKMTAPKGNFGEMQNKGVELTITSVNIDRKDFKWTTNLQLSHNKNELVSLSGSGNSALYGRPQWDAVGDFISISKAGEPLYQFYGYRTDGLYQSYEDLLNSPRPEGTEISRTNGVYVGDVKFKDLDGNGVINEKDMTVIGDPNPDLVAGLTNTFTYKGFELSLFLTASYGNDVFNYNKLTLTSMKSLWNNQLTDVADHAVLVNKDDVANCYILNSGTSMPRIVLGDPAKNTRHSDRYVEDGSYIKIKSISLSYNFPKKWLSYVKLNAAKLSANLSNVYTFTKYEGMDPEVGVSQTTRYVSGVDIGRYPSPRIMNFGLNIQF